LATTEYMRLEFADYDYDYNLLIGEFHHQTVIQLLNNTTSISSRLERFRWSEHDLDLMNDN
jgi:hypothetical protein